MAIWLAALLVASACSPGEPPPVRGSVEGTAFGTYYSISLPGVTDQAELAALQEDVDALLEGIDAVMSTYRADSELNALNAAPPGEWLEISASLYETLAVALQVAEDTGGAFDVTVGQLVNLWGFGPDGRPERVPDRDEIERALAETGPDRIELDPERQAARRAGPVFVDLSGVAKGYAVDALAALLDAQGFDAYLASIGGDMVARGRPEPDRPWRIGIEHPGSVTATPIHALELRDRTIATSGDYRNFFEHEGRRYAHIIDPRTGAPVDHGLASVSVLHARNAWADAYATALLVLGHEEGLAAADRLGLAVLFIVAGEDGFELHESRALRGADADMLPAAGEETAARPRS